MDKINKAPSIEEFKSLLKGNGLKVTPQRLAVHEAMLRLGHACADMVTAEILASGQAKVRARAASTSAFASDAG